MRATAPFCRQSSNRINDLLILNKILIRSTVVEGPTRRVCFHAPNPSIAFQVTESGSLMISRAELKRLQAQNNYPSISLLAPTHRTAPANQRDPIVVKNLLAKGTER